MNKILRIFPLRKILCLFVLFCFIIPASSITIYKVGEEFTSYEYNEDWERWFTRNMTVWIGKDPLEKTVLFFYFSSRSGDIVIDMGSSESQQLEFRKAIDKVLGWSVTARQSKVNAKRVIGCYGKKNSKICKQTGIADKKGELGLRFFSTNSGQEVNLVFSIIDKDNAIHKATIYFNPVQLEKFLEVLESVG